jgi:double-stranded uracil-DNA glycosylase
VIAPLAPRRPTRDQVFAAAGQHIPDVIAPRLCVLFCGINPSLYSAATGHHFARPGNRFWRALHEARFTPRLLSPTEDHRLLEHGCGLTNLVARATAAASELEAEELIAGRRRLARSVARHRPRIVAVLGIGAYRTAFARPAAEPGRQAERLGTSLLWVLPNPSGLNAHYQLAELASAFQPLYAAAFRAAPRNTRVVIESRGE